MDIIFLMIHEIPICHVKNILLRHGKYSYDVAMIIQHIIYLVTSGLFWSYHAFISFYYI